MQLSKERKKRYAMKKKEHAQIKRSRIVDNCRSRETMTKNILASTIFTLRQYNVSII